MSVEPAERHALILSGGASYAAYEVGVVKALLGGGNAVTGGHAIDPPILTGTSAGAFNAAVMVSQPDREAAATAQALERCWTESIAESSQRCGNGVFRWRADPLQVLSPGCVLANPWQFFADTAEDGLFLARELLERGAALASQTGPPENRLLGLFDMSSLITTTPYGALVRGAVSFAGIRRSHKVLQIAATNWENGELRMFGNLDMTDELGPLAIMASSAVPGFFPPVTIESSPYVDGGVLMNTPLSPAIKAGATTLHVVYLDPDISRIPIQRLRTTFGTLQRAFSIGLAATFNRDIKMAEDVNKGLAALRRTAFGKADLPLQVAQRIFEQPEGGASFRPLTIHRYHPRDELGGPLGFLDFSRSHIESLIERGFQDAAGHDCKSSGCVIPEET